MSTIKKIDLAEAHESVSRFKGAEWMVEPLDILLLGAGGIGSWTGFFLSRIGHNLSVFDDDTYEVGNMSGQFVANCGVGVQKSEALVDLMYGFSGEAQTFNHSNYGRYEENSMTSPITIACFDNMASRRLAFDKWFNYLRENPDKRKDAIFIDGRLLAELFQIFTIQGSDIKQIKKYYKYLFSDDVVEPEDCSLKQTSHVAAMIGAEITSTFNNWIANKVTGINFRKVPFYQERFTPTIMQKLKSEKEM